LECPKYEADDVIATIVNEVLREEVENSSKDGGRNGGGLSGVNVLSGDKDLMQLVTTPDVFPSVHMIEPMNMIRISYDEVITKWGVPPEKLGDVLALAGDSSDNIPGVPGIGPKIAASLINDFGSLNDLLARADEIKQKGRREKILNNADMARLSRKLVELEKLIPLDKIEMESPSTYLSSLDSMADLRMDGLNASRLLDFYHKMGFWDMKQRVKERMMQKGLLNERNYADSGSMGASSLTSSSTGRDLTSDTENSASKGQTSFNRLIVNKRKKLSPPKPEEFDDIPF